MQPAGYLANQVAERCMTNEIKKSMAPLHLSSNSDKKTMLASGLSYPKTENIEVPEI